MSVHFFVDDVVFDLKNKRILKYWIKKVCNNEKKVVGNINFIFTSNEKILSINVQYLKHDYFTDIITFNYNTNAVINGDIFISVDKVKENAILYNCQFTEEIFRVIIHGVLHLIGFDDKSRNDKAIMKNMENQTLEMLHLEFKVF